MGGGECLRTRLKRSLPKASPQHLLLSNSEGGGGEEGPSRSSRHPRGGWQVGVNGLEPEPVEGLGPFLRPMTPAPRDSAWKRGGAEERQETRLFCDHGSSKLVFSESFWDTRFPSSWKVGGKHAQKSLSASPDSPRYEIPSASFF